ncbi:MAG: DUF3179 domain-containing protein [Chloroflexia bacterium]|nr:DUF3179 domain-containing protein [Chloroflexia bacterium]
MVRYGIALMLAGAILMAACGATTEDSISGPTPPPSVDRSASLGPTTETRTHEPAVDLGEVQFGTSGWKTDFSKHSVPLDEIIPGGPPRDGIPPIDDPKFESVEKADSWLESQEPVILLEVGRDARAFPLQILLWHEIVNDVASGVPVTVTFCPLCNTAIAFDRRVAGRTLDFGTSGNLRNSDLVMWDRQTESWWQQVTGKAIVGDLTGKGLTMLPTTIIPWKEFRRQFPEGRVLSRDTGHRRSYGANPYAGYDKVDEPPFLFEGKLDGRLPPKERVVTISLSGEDAAYPFSILAKERVITDSVGGQPIVVVYQPGTASALDASSIAASRDVGAAGVYRPEVDGRRLTFSWQESGFVDAETGSRWTVLGRAIDGPLAGKALEPVVHANHFWFAWAAFKPDTRIYGSG